MSATTPVWPLLAVAGITVTGTLGATIVTLWRAARREDVRWHRERQDRHQEDRKQFHLTGNTDNAEVVSKWVELKESTAPLSDAMRNDLGLVEPTAELAEKRNKPWPAPNSGRSFTFAGPAA